MKIKIVIIAFCAILIGGTVNAQEFERPPFLFSGGLSLPLSPNDFSDFWNMGFNLSVATDILWTPSSDLNISFEFHRFGIEESGFLENQTTWPGNYSVLGGSTSVISITTNWKRYFVDDATVIPFFLVGFGLFRLGRDKMEIYTPTNGNVDTILSSNKMKVGLNSGLGFEIPFNDKVDFFVETRYVLGLTSEYTHVLPFKVGIKVR